MRTPGPITLDSRNETELQRWYVLILLTAVYALNIADRFVISTLIEPIKAELHISDSAVGFLTGASLALFYVAAGLPLSALADRVNRRNLVALSLGAWSLMTVACGFTRTFWQLAAARVLVGVGEAGGTPPSQSLVSDHFPWRRCAFALSEGGRLTPTDDQSALARSFNSCVGVTTELRGNFSSHYVDLGRCASRGSRLYLARNILSTSIVPQS